MRRHHTVLHATWFAVCHRLPSFLYDIFQEQCNMLISPGGGVLLFLSGVRPHNILQALARRGIGSSRLTVFCQSLVEGPAAIISSRPFLCSNVTASPFPLVSIDPGTHYLPPVFSIPLFFYTCIFTVYSQLHEPSSSMALPCTG